MSTPAEKAVPKFKKVKSLTLPQLKFKVGLPLYVKITGAIYQSKEVKGRNTNTDAKKKEPPFLCNCIDLTTGEECQIITASVIKSTLEENYADAGYVGKGFEIVKQARQEGKEYDKYSVTEIEVPGDEVAPTAKAKK